MSQIALIRLFIRICDAFEFWLVPQSMRCAAAVYVGIKTLPEKLEFLRIALLPWYERLFRLPAAWLRRSTAVLGRIRGKLPVWCLRLLRWLRHALVDALVIGGSAGLLALLWLHLWT